MLYNTNKHQGSCPAKTLALFMSIVLEHLSEPQPNIETVFNEYDFIVVGGGTAGCVIANRLSEIASWTVLLLEAGVEQPRISDVPALFPIILSSRDVHWNYETLSQPEICDGKPCSYPRGKMLGGCSSHNAMLYTRGNKKCFDNWSKIGNSGWSYLDVLPYFKKSEDNRNIDVALDTFHHNSGGYLSIQRFEYNDQNTRAIVRAMQEMNLPEVDINGDRQDGFCVAQFTVRNGERMSTNRAFLEPVRYKRSNLHVVTSATVIKVLMNEKSKRAFGVKCILKEFKLKTFYAKKEVILSAGVINSPQLLQLSGIGPGEVLEPLNIPIIKVLRGVGRNLQDHSIPHTGISLKLNRTATTVKNINEIYNDINKYNNFRRGPLSGLSNVVSYWLSPYAEEGIPDISFFFVNSFTPTHKCKTVRNLTTPDVYYNTIAIVPMLTVSRSRGFVKINSRDPYVAPLILLNILTDSSDFEALVEGLYFSVNISESESFRKMGMDVDRTSVPKCLHLDFGTKAYWRCVLRGDARHMGHSVGTCKMGPKYDKLAVVDPKLKVYGVSSLRVVDASVMPTIVNANTNAAVVMISERAADFIKEDWI